MADVCGPTSRLPGSLCRVPPGQTCDTEGHEQILATRRVQGECDSEILRHYNQTSKGLNGNRKEMGGKPGCYIALHVESDKVYVGSTSSLYDRVTDHITALRRNVHKNKPLQELYNENPHVEFFVQPTASKRDAEKLEQQLVDGLMPTGKVCNVAVKDVLKSKLGVKLSEEHKAAMLKCNLGLKRSDEVRENMRKAHLGKPLSELQKENLSKSHLARLSTPEGKASHAKGIQKLMHSVMCDGHKFESKTAAAIALGVDVTTIMHRCKSNNYPNYYEV